MRWRRNDSVSAISEHSDLTNSFRERINTSPLILMRKDVGKSFSAVTEGRGKAKREGSLERPLPSLGDSVSQGPGSTEGRSARPGRGPNRRKLPRNTREQRRPHSDPRGYSSLLVRYLEIVPSMCV